MPTATPTTPFEASLWIYLPVRMNNSGRLGRRGGRVQFVFDSSHDQFVSALPIAAVRLINRPGGTVFTRRLHLPIGRDGQPDLTFSCYLPAGPGGLLVGSYRQYLPDIDRSRDGYAVVGWSDQFPPTAAPHHNEQGMKPAEIEELRARWQQRMHWDNRTANSVLPGSVDGYDLHRLFGEFCRLRHSWGLLISHQFTEETPGRPFHSGTYFGDLTLAAPYLQLGDSSAPWISQAIFEGQGFYVGSEREVQDLYNQTVGDDGPTELNPYDGPVRVYALTFAPDGRTMNENT